MRLETNAYNPNLPESPANFNWDDLKSSKPRYEGDGGEPDEDELFNELLDSADPACRELKKQTMRKLENKVLWKHLDGPDDAWHMKREAMQTRADERINDLSSPAGRLKRVLIAQKRAVWDTAHKTLAAIRIVDDYRQERKKIIEENNVAPDNELLAA